jgi:hypothetical protein
MLRPITEATDLVHNLVRHSVLMLGDEILHGVVGVERCRDRYRGNHNADQPIKN